MTALVTRGIEGQVATLTLNRPDKMNALNLPMWRALSAELQEIAGHADIRCVILRGAGSHFAAGADLAEFATERANTAAAEAYGALMLEALWTLRDLPQPTIAAIAGNCLGAGLELAAMCDLRIAASDAKFGVPIQRVGITMPYPELAALVRLLGRATMLEILLEGRLHDADWAAGRGLVGRVVAPEALEASVAESAARIVTGSPLSNRNHKKFTQRCLSPEPLTPDELRASYAAVEGADYREGIAAFMARRKPVFSGQ